MPVKIQFRYFMRLPKPIRDRIWELHRHRGGVRHYLTQLPNRFNNEKLPPRHYAAIDTETNEMVRTGLGVKALHTFWDKEDKPIKGESDAKVRLVGETWCHTDHGSNAVSITTILKTRIHGTLYNLHYRKYIRINYKFDVIVLDGEHTCLQPLFSLQHWNRINWGDLRDRWFWNVQHLALDIASCRNDVEKAVAALPAIKHVYLLVYRDPMCANGAPRTWKEFDKQRHFNKHKFMHITDFRALHPCKKARPCECETESSRAVDVERAFRRAFLAEYKLMMVEIAVVADPY